MAVLKYTLSENLPKKLSWVYYEGRQGLECQMVGDKE